MTGRERVPGVGEFDKGFGILPHMVNRITSLTSMIGVIGALVVFFSVYGMAFGREPVVASPTLPPESLPPGGVVIVEASTSLGRLIVGGNDAPETTRTSMVEVTGMPFKQAIRADVSRASEHHWFSQYNLTFDQPLEQGDVLLARIWARCEWSMTGQAQVPMVFELNTPPWDKSLEFQTSVGAQWKLINVPFKARRAFKAGESHLVIRLGTAKQKLDIGSVEIIRFDKSTSLDALPRTKIDYAGRNLDAPWRTTAQERIEKIRKADMVVMVVDAQGKPVAGASVRANMTRHAFPFGTAVSAGAVLGDQPNNERYRKELLRLFNCVVVENDLKWPNLISNGYDRASKLIDWMEQHNMPVRGHNLIWPGEEFLPKVAIDRSKDPEEFRKLLNSQVSYTTTFFKGRLYEWDVLNEPFTNRLVEQKLGREAFVDFFKLAHAADPSSKLYINDFAILETGDQLSTPHMEHYFETIKFLIDQGAPVHGIGIQGHFASNISTPDTMLKILDRFGSFGLPIKITEFDMNTTDRELQADFMRDFMTVCFSHPSVEGVLQWGFWSRAHWMPDAGLFDEEWNLLPHGKVYEELITKTWRTDQTLSTDASGVIKLRGFKGDYELTTTVEGKPVSLVAKLDKDGDTFTLQIPSN